MCVLADTCVGGRKIIKKRCRDLFGSKCPSSRALFCTLFDCRRNEIQGLCGEIGEAVYIYGGNGSTGYNSVTIDLVALNKTLVLYYDNDYIEFSCRGFNVERELTDEISYHTELFVETFSCGNTSPISADYLIKNVLKIENSGIATCGKKARS